MRKFVIMAVICVMSVMVFWGCAPAPKADGEQVKNPLKTYESVEEMSEETGIDMKLPHSAELLLVQAIDGKLNEVNFKVADGTEFNYRKAKSDFADVNGKDDISGNYAKWGDTHQATTPGGITVTIKTADPENKEAGMAVWNDGTYKYSIAMDKAYDEELLLAAVDSVK